MVSLANLTLRAGEVLLSFGRHVPFLVQRQLIEAAIARLFALPLAEGEFDLLEGRWLRLEVVDLGLAWNLTRDRHGLRLAEQSPVDVCIRGNWREFLLLASHQEDPDTLFFRRRLLIEGDTELGLALRNLLDSLDPDHLPVRLWQLLRWLGKAAQEREPDERPEEEKPAERSPFV